MYTCNLTIKIVNETINSLWKNCYIQEERKFRDTQKLKIGYIRDTLDTYSKIKKMYTTVSQFKIINNSKIVGINEKRKTSQSQN